VDEVLAGRYFPNQNPIGHRLNIYDSPMEIVGVVGHVKQWGLDTDDANTLRAQFYISFRQFPDDAMPGVAGGVGVVLRTAGDPLRAVESIRRTLREMNGEQVVFEIETMDEIISESLAARRFSMLLLGAFAGLALLLASVGIYGVISYLAGRRTHEIGVRMALGAQRKDVLRLVLGQGIRMAFIGVAIGLAAALALTRLLATYSMLFGVSVVDPLTFASVAVLLMLVAIAACYIPARRAMRVDPMVALRHE
jgi:ABC-type antimicrobial peptide transport system permease subunit